MSHSSIDQEPADQAPTQQEEEGRWVLYPSPEPTAPVRLVCLSYAGGGASAYRSWPASLPGVEVATVELPGRETRVSEPCYLSIADLVPDLADALVAHLDRPYAVFGHSLGGRIAFELIRELRRRQAPGPIALFVSACRAPHIPRVPTAPLSSLPDTDFAAMLRRISGTPPEVFDDPELLTMLLPVLRADFTLVDTYEYHDEPALGCPIRAFGGVDDPEAPEDSLLAWQAHTTSSFSVSRYSGGHFILQARRREMTEAILAELSCHGAP